MDLLLSVLCLPIFQKVNTRLGTCWAEDRHRAIRGRLSLLLVSESALHPVPKVLPLTGCPQELFVSVLVDLVSSACSKKLRCTGTVFGNALLVISWSFE